MFSTYMAMFCIVAGIIALCIEGARLERKMSQLRQEREECCGRAED